MLLERTKALLKEIREQIMMEECSLNIIKNIDRHLDRRPEDHYQVNRLLTARWYVANEINSKTS